MTAKQILRELKSRKEPILAFLSELLIESGLKDTKVIEVKKEKEVIKEITSEEKLILEGKVAELKQQLNVSENKVAELTAQLAPAETRTETISTGDTTK